MQPISNPGITYIYEHQKRQAGGNYEKYGTTVRKGGPTSERIQADPAEHSQICYVRADFVVITFPVSNRGDL